MDLSVFSDNGIEIGQVQDINPEKDETLHLLDINTLNEWMPFWTRNAAENYNLIPKDPRALKTLSHIKNIHWGKEAAILASGPSLDDSIQYLKDFRGIIFSGNSTINPCIANGIKPDWVHVLDADEYVPNQFKDIDTLGMKVLLPTYVHPTVGKIFNPDLTWWFNVYDYRHWFTFYGLHYLFEKLDGLLASGCCPAGMIRLAHYMGIRKMYLLGFDFGFPEGKERCTTYEKKESGWTPIGIDEFCIDRSPKETINGIETTLKLKVAHSTVIGIIKTLTDLQVIDCSSGIMNEYPKQNFEEVVNG